MPVLPTGWTHSPACRLHVFQRHGREQDAAPLVPTQNMPTIRTLAASCPSQIAPRVAPAYVQGSAVLQPAAVDVRPRVNAPRYLILILSLFPAAIAGEKLYNGIELPQEWPPHRLAAELATREPMAVPYLKNPPAVIPIDVGRQLFVDEFLIENTTLQRTWHKPEYYSGNPILKPTARWERSSGSLGAPEGAFPFHGGVWFDPADHLFKMWYTYGTASGIALALSKDGIKWERPSLDLQPGTNIVRVASQIDSVTVWLDLEEKNPARRYKMYEFDRDCWKGRILFSPDGIHWTHETWVGPTYDGTSFFYNPFRKVWAISMRSFIEPPTLPPKPEWGKGTFVVGRARRYWENKDFVALTQWEAGQLRGSGEDWGKGKPVWWLMADKNDKPRLNILGLVPEIYHVDSVGYESLMLGEFVIWHFHPPGRPKVNEVYFSFSRDGFHYSRGSYDPMLPTSPDKDAWNAGNVQDVTGLCCIVGDRLYFYCSGRSSDPRNPSNEGQLSTGLAFLRRDGFCSMDATTRAGQLTTRPVVFKGSHLFVNASAGTGRMVVEVLDADGKVLAPFTKENCNPVSVDKTLHPVTWKGNADLGKLAGKKVKFRFHLENGQLYSFWVSPDQSGASYGFVAGGGPGFTSNRDTVGSAAYK